VTTITIHRCRSCGQPITWAETEGGERMPCDAHPVVGGNVRLVERPGRVPLARVVGDTVDMFDATDDGTRFYAHFVTCPQAAEWRTA